MKCEPLKRKLIALIQFEFQSELQWADATPIYKKTDLT